MKTKIILIGLIVCFILISGCIGNNQLNYEISGCDNSLLDVEENIELNVVGNSVEFMYIVDSYCNFKDKAKVKLYRDGNNLIVKDMFSSFSVAKCNCAFEITGTISGLEKGDYNIKFISVNKYADVESLKGEEFFTIL